MTSQTQRTAVAVAVMAVFAGLIVFEVDHAVRNRGLPLGYVSVIREQASEKHLDPALIAAVIYAETKFDPRPSAAGAEGLMQIMPSTAYFIAGLSGGTQFTASDLGTPSVNVAYGSYYLKYLLEHYDDNQMLAVAAYNAGMGNVDEWVARARAAGTPMGEEEIPFPQTREYVRRVLAAERDYSDTYARALGLS
jgi:soluble lytic murein transglycosylase